MITGFNTDVPWSDDDLRAADRELVTRLLEGDQAAFSELVESYHQQMVRVVSAFVSSRAVAEEVVQETWLAALERSGRWDATRPLLPWLLGILAVEARRHRRRDAGARDSAPLRGLELPRVPLVVQRRPGVTL